jgi:hypothetical protein
MPTQIIELHAPREVTQVGIRNAMGAVRTLAKRLRRTGIARSKGKFCAEYCSFFVDGG